MKFPWVYFTYDGHDYRFSFLETDNVFLIQKQWGENLPFERANLVDDGEIIMLLKTYKNTLVKSILLALETEDRLTVVQALKDSLDM